MKSKKEIIDFLRPFCEENGIPIVRVEDQLCAIGRDVAILCVPNPEAPPPDGLANDTETLMLPTLYVRIKSGKMEIETTEYTEKYLIKAA